MDDLFGHHPEIFGQSDVGENILCPNFDLNFEDDDRKTSMENSPDFGRSQRELSESVEFLGKLEVLGSG